VRYIHKTLAFVAIAGWFAGCVPHYKSPQEMPAELQTDLKAVEQHYLEEASRSAAFAASCDEAKTQSTIVSTSRTEFLIRAPGKKNGAYLHGDQIATIGVDACGTKATYKVLCGPDEEYAAVVFKNSKLYEKMAPCKVVAEAMASQTTAAHADETRALVIEQVARDTGCSEENVEITEEDHDLYKVRACGGSYMYKRSGHMVHKFDGGD